MAKVIRRDLEQKLAALEGAEWDSMSESDLSGGEASDGDELKPPPLPRHAKKAGRKGKGGGSVVPVGPAGEPSGVVYIGHIPHGFYEEAMNGFFKQFGDVIRVRISRSKKSGRCKGYAYVEFASPEVAQIVAETMNGYYLFDKQLVCRVLKFEEIHPNLFDGAGVKFRKVNWHGLYREKYNADRTQVKDEKHTAKLLKKDKAKKDKLAKLGIDYDFPGFVATLKDRNVAKGPFQKPKGAKQNKESAKVEDGKGGKETWGGRGGEGASNANDKRSAAKAEAAAKASSKGDDAPSAKKSKSSAQPATVAAKSTPKAKGSAKMPSKPTEAEEKDVAAATSSGKSLESVKGKKGSGKKVKAPKMPEPTVVASVGSTGKKKKAKSPKSGGGAGKKRPLEEAEEATPAAASPASTKKPKSAKRSKA
ncbi:unnamed protein product [Ectocarpus sp. CCAP 1310/34]|nr:unnamed protein product [Ectocarpus sp. CCAP 1310/34]